VQAPLPVVIWAPLDNLSIWTSWLCVYYFGSQTRELIVDKVAADERIWNRRPTDHESSSKRDWKSIDFGGLQLFDIEQLGGCNVKASETCQVF